MRNHHSFCSQYTGGLGNSWTNSIKITVILTLLFSIDTYLKSNERISKEKGRVLPYFLDFYSLTDHSKRCPEGVSSPTVAMCERTVRTLNVKEELSWETRIETHGATTFNVVHLACMSFSHEIDTASWSAISEPDHVHVVSGKNYLQWLVFNWTFGIFCWTNRVLRVSKVGTLKFLEIDEIDVCLKR